MGDPGVYVVRVYRRDPTSMVGVVESVESGEQLPFQSTEQLWRAIHSLSSPRQRQQTSHSDEEEGK